MKLPRILLTLLLAFGILTGITAVVQAKKPKYPQPAYTVIKRSNNFEIRTYAPMIVAEVTTLGKNLTASNEGFKILYHYITGANRSHTKLAMTTPVMQFPFTNREPSDQWVTQFVLPKETTLKNVPTPTDARIRIVSIPQKTWAVHTFSGNANQGTIAKHRKELLNTLQTTKGMPQILAPFPVVTAFYDNPLTLPPFKHNAVMVEVQP